MMNLFNLIKEGQICHYVYIYVKKGNIIIPYLHKISIQADILVQRNSMRS
jgi:hypothetical protein